MEAAGLEGFNVYPNTWARNWDVTAIEHSASIQPGNDPGTSLLTPLIRRGHVVTIRRGLHWQFPDVTMLELSFPAMRGASGAPVFHESTMAVVGVLVANAERELAPAQIIQAFREDGSKIEEIRYFLPSGVAVASQHLVDAIATAKSAFFGSRAAADEAVRVTTAWQAPGEGLEAAQDAREALALGIKPHIVADFGTLVASDRARTGIMLRTSGFPATEVDVEVLRRDGRHIEERIERIEPATPGEHHVPHVVVVAEEASSTVRGTGSSNAQRSGTATKDESPATS